MPPLPKGIIVQSTEGAMVDADAGCIDGVYAKNEGVVRGLDALTKLQITLRFDITAAIFLKNRRVFFL